MKLFSSAGKHAADGGYTRLRFAPLGMTGQLKRPKLLCRAGGMPIYAKDVATVCGVTLAMLFVGIWLFTSAPTGTAQAVEYAEDNPSVTAEAVTAPLTQGSLEQDNSGEALALAMGIDAVISSVPGGELADNLTMVMVGNTIMNRVDCSRYPNTIEEVLCQPKQFSCFESTGVKWVGKAASNEEFKQRCLDAAERVLDGERHLSAGVVYVSTTKQGTVEAQLDGLYFCK